MSKFEHQKFFFTEKKNDDVIFPVSVLVSNFAGLTLEAKFETKTGLGLGLGKNFQSRSWSRKKFSVSVLVSDESGSTTALVLKDSTSASLRLFMSQ